MNSRREATRPNEGQNGSITVLMALMIPILALMIMLVMDIAQLIFEKVRLQNVADACAYSAATVQAAGLNEIADLNKSAMDELEKLEKILQRVKSAPFNEMTDGQNTIQFYNKIFKNIRDYQDKANSEYASKALKVAKQVKKINLDDKGIRDVSIKSINPKFKDGGSGKLMEYSQKIKVEPYDYWLDAPCVPKPCMQQATNWNDGLAGDPKHEGRHDGTSSIEKNSMARSVGIGIVQYKISKKNSPTTYSAFELKHAPHDLILAPSIFGRTETLRAYAAAMPTKGNVVNGDPQYTVVLVRLGSLNPKPSASDLSKVLH